MLLMVQVLHAGLEGIIKSDMRGGCMYHKKDCLPEIRLRCQYRPSWAVQMQLQQY